MSKELCAAVKTGNMPKYLELVFKFGNEVKDETGNPLVHQALLSNQMAIFNDLVDKQFANLNLAGAGGDTCLHIAARTGDTALCKRIVTKAQFTLTIKNKAGMTPSVAAADAGKDVVATLLGDLADFEEVKKVALRGNDALVKFFQTKTEEEQKKLVQLKNLGGDTLMHVVFKVPPPKGTRLGGGDLAATMLKAGADVNALDALGKTPLHNATLWGYTNVVKEFLAADPEPDLTIKDHTGWTVVDQAAAIGGVDPAIEDLLLDAGGKSGTVALGEAKSTVDILLAATLTDQPTQEGREKALARFRASLESLYQQKEFRAVLDLAALDTLGERTKDKKPLRIYLGAGEDTKSVNGDVAGRGSYTGELNGKSCNTLSLAVGHADGEVGGTLVHELTHHAAFMLFNNDGKPYAKGDKEAEKKHLAAYEKFARATHLAVGPQEQKLANNIVGRVNGYAPESDKMIPEFVAGVPQSVYLYGSEMVNGLAPECLKDFLDLADLADQKVKKDDPGFDNVALIEKVTTTLPPVKPVYGGVQAMDVKEISVDYLVDLLGKQLISQGGKATVNDKKPIPCTIDDFEPEDREAHQKTLERVRVALTEAFEADELPPRLTGDALRALVETTTELVQRHSENGDLKKAVAVNTRLWARFAMTDLIEAKHKAGEELTDEDIAEATVLAAELKTWKEEGTLDGAPQVNPKKHKQMVDALALELNTLGKKDSERKEHIRKSALKFIDKQSSAMAGGKAKGFARSLADGWTSTAGPNEVGIDVKTAKNQWLEGLKKF